MRDLNNSEISIICGAENNLWCGSEFSSHLYGATMGCAIAAPISLIVLMFSLTNETSILWNGVLLSGVIFSTGLVSGAFVGNLSSADYLMCELL